MQSRARRVGGCALASLIVFAALSAFTSRADAQQTEEQKPKTSTFAIRLAPWDSNQQIPVRLVGRIDRYYGGGFQPRSRGFAPSFHFGGAYGYVHSYNRRSGLTDRSHLYHYRHRPRTSESPGFSHPYFQGFQSYGYGDYYRGYSPHTYD